MISRIFNLKRAIFPIIIMTLSLIVFLILCWILTQILIEPYYWPIPLFAIPFITFGIISYFTAKERISASVSIITSCSLIISFCVLTACLFVFILFESATTTSQNSSRYEKALAQMGYSDNLTSFFPREIPEGAENIKFTYHPAFGQGGEQLTLRYETDSETIRSYKQYLTKAAKWFGTPDEKEGQEYGIFDGTLNIFSDIHKRLPNDLIIYVIYSEPYRFDNWNHGKLSFVGISEENKEVMFYAEAW